MRHAVVLLVVGTFLTAIGLTGDYRSSPLHTFHRPKRSDNRDKTFGVPCFYDQFKFMRACICLRLLS